MSTLRVITNLGSGALNGKMLDLETGYFFLFLDPAGPYPNPIPYPAGQCFNLYLT